MKGHTRLPKVTSEDIATSPACLVQRHCSSLSGLKSSANKIPRDSLLTQVNAVLGGIRCDERAGQQQPRTHRNNPPLICKCGFSWQACFHIAGQQLMQAVKVAGSHTSNPHAMLNHQLLQQCRHPEYRLVQLLKSNQHGLA